MWVFPLYDMLFRDDTDTEALSTGDTNMPTKQIS